MVIQVKEGFKEDFLIGHSTTTSQTFLPCFKKLSDDLFFADIAGFHDTSGELIEFINCFVNKKIFLRATQVKFLFPVTHSQITINRGVEVKE